MAQRTLTLCFQPHNNFKLIGYIDYNNRAIIDDRKNTSRYTFHFGTGVVSWASKKQPIVTLSLAEVEYVVATSVACQAIWMRRVLKYLSQKHQELTTIFCNNNSTIALSKNHVFHKTTKHIDTRFHFIRELVNDNEICLEFCRFEDQLSINSCT